LQELSHLVEKKQMTPVIPKPLGS